MSWIELIQIYHHDSVLHRDGKPEDEEQRQQQEAIARAQVAQAREAQERHMQQQQNQSQTVIKDAPWFYADPQGNIQVCYSKTMESPPFR